MPYAKKECEVCTREFKPPHRKFGEATKRCRSCIDLAEGETSVSYKGYKGGPKLPKVETHTLAPPLKQAVFDLETFSLDRGWGVLMVGSILVHGDGPTPKMYTFDLTQSSTWPNIRSEDGELAAKIIKVLSDCDIAYAHNGANYDLPWLNSIALKYGLPPLKIKLIDPVQVARRKYRIGSNSLGSLANFLNIPETKMPVPPDTWRFALFNNDKAAWATLRERCESDVRVLNLVAGKVTKDVGMVDYSGSAWR
jgi:hypothetical protein